MDGVLVDRNYLVMFFCSTAHLPSRRHQPTLGAYRSARNDAEAFGLQRLRQQLCVRDNLPRVVVN